MDSCPLKVTFLTCKFNLSTKGHAKEYYDRLSVWSGHLQGQSPSISKRRHHIVTLSCSLMKWILDLFDSWPLKVTFSTLRYNISARGHAKGHYYWLPGGSRHFQSQTLCIPKRVRYILAPSHSTMKKWILDLLKLQFRLTYNMSAKGHAKGLNDQRSGWSCHFQGQSVYIPKRCHYIVALSPSPMKTWILGL